jgi:hypothetical protein
LDKWAQCLVPLHCLERESRRYIKERGNPPLRLKGHSTLCPYTAWSGCSKLPICKSPSSFGNPSASFDKLRTRLRTGLRIGSYLSVRLSSRRSPQVERGVHGGRDSSPRLRMTRGTEDAQLCAPTRTPGWRVFSKH